MDWPEVRKALGEVGYDGWVTTEIEGGDAAYLKDVVARFDRFLAGQKPVVAVVEPSSRSSSRGASSVSGARDPPSQRRRIPRDPPTRARDPSATDRRDHDMITRRQALQLGAAAAVAPAADSPRPAARARPRAARPRVRLAVSTYSYWHFKPEKYPIEKVIEHAAAIGFEGVEILRRQMKDETPAYVNGLKKAAFRDGLSLPMLSIHQDFVSPDPMERQRHVDITTRSLQLAADLGTPVRAPELRPLEDDQVLRRPDEGEGRRAAPARPHAGGGDRLVRPVDRGVPAHRREARRDARAREPLGPHHAAGDPAGDLREGPLALARRSTSTPATSRASRTPGSSCSRRTR